MTNEMETSIVVTVVLAAFKTIELVISKMREKPENEDSQKISRLYEMHMKTDDDGTPIWYFPRSQRRIQQDIIDKIQDIAENQIKTATIMERILQEKDRG